MDGVDYPGPADVDKKTRTTKRLSDGDQGEYSRLPYERCDWVDHVYHKLSWVEVSNGCCAFYSGKNCEGDTHLFSMDRREDKWLKGAHDDAIGSWWCSDTRANEPR